MKIGRAPPGFDPTTPELALRPPACSGEYFALAGFPALLRGAHFCSTTVVQAMGKAAETGISSAQQGVLAQNASSASTVTGSQASPRPAPVLTFPIISLTPRTASLSRSVSSPAFLADPKGSLDLHAACLVGPLDLAGCHHVDGVPLVEVEEPAYPACVCHPQLSLLSSIASPI